jgi:hypothetical protein
MDILLMILFVRAFRCYYCLSFRYKRTLREFRTKLMKLLLFDSYDIFKMIETGILKMSPGHTWAMENL